MPGTDKMFPLVKPGDPIKADAWNEITTQLIALSNLGDSCDVIATGAGTFRRECRRGGGTSLTPYIITEVGEGDVNVAVYRAGNATVTGQSARMVSGTWETDVGAADEDLDTTVMRGVSFTGQCVLVATVKGEKRIVAGFGGEVFHGASAAATIDADSAGLIDIAYLNAAGVSQLAQVTATNTLDRGFVLSDSILLTTFSDASQTFKIIVGGCP